MRESDSPALIFSMNDKILLLGYGNPDREDDGVAWHVLKSVAEGLGYPPPSTPDESFESTNDRIDLIFLLQLVPEISEIIASYDAVCFVDAHTGEINAGVRAVKIEPGFQKSPFTHHLTPQTCLELTNSIYGKRPAGYLVSIRGFGFQFEERLTPGTEKYARVASGLILDWLRTGEFAEATIP